MKARGIVAVAVVAGMVCCPWLRAGEQEVDLARVPPGVIKAVEKAVEGIRIIQAKVEQEKGQTIYEIEGTVDGRRVEVEVSPEGEVLEIERGADKD